MVNDDNIHHMALRVLYYPSKSYVVIRNQLYESYMAVTNKNLTNREASDFVDCS